MTELSAEARRLLTLARTQQLRTGPEVRARVRSAIAAQLTAAASPGPSAPPGRSWQWAAAHTKWLVLAGLGIAGAGAYLYGRPSTPSPAPAAFAPLVLHVATAAPRSSAQASPAPPEPPGAAPSAHAEPAPAPAEREERSLRAELTLLRRAHSALDAHDPRRALVALRAHRERFEHGQLSEEREGLNLIARCLTGNESTRAAQRFLQKAPESTLRARVIETCKLPPSAAP